MWAESQRFGFHYAAVPHILHKQIYSKSLKNTRATGMSKQSKESSLLTAEVSPAGQIHAVRSLLQDRLKRQYEDILRDANYVPLKMYLSNETPERRIYHEMQELERHNSAMKDEDAIIFADLLQRSSSTHEPVRTVLMRGISGSGKTTAVRRFVLDWANGRTHQHLDFVFPLHLSELNLLQKEKCSLLQLMDLFFPKLLQPETLKRAQVLFIFDGLGEFRFPLHFKHAKTCVSPLEPLSVDLLLVNVLRGNLLPSAQVLVTSKLKDAGAIPPEHVQRVVDVHGFDDLQWEEEIRRAVRDQSVANKVIVHVKSSRSLYIMRPLPVFCQMAATVLEELFSESCQDAPLTLTEIFTHFLLIQMRRSALQQESPKAEERSTLSGTEEILKLGRLAWCMLEKNMVTFLENDLREVEVDPVLAVRLSQKWPMIFTQEELRTVGYTYRFTHPSVQEFLAALYVSVNYKPSKGNVLPFTLAETVERFLRPTKTALEMHRRAVNRALKSKTGQLDLFLMFLLGISAGPSNNLLPAVLQHSSCNVRREDVVMNIMEKIQKNPSYEVSVNLSRCLEEFDVALSMVIKRDRIEFVRNVDTDVTPSEWSREAKTFLTCKDSLVTFDVSKYTNADEAFRRLLPVIKTCRVLRLDWVSDLSWSLLATSLKSPANRIREIDARKMRINMQLLSAGLESCNCKVEILRLPYIGSEDGGPLFSALSLNPSHLRELTVWDSYSISDRTVQLLSETLVNPLCHLEKLSLHSGCNISLASFKILAAALGSGSCGLKELDLDHCFPGDKLNQALQLLSEGLRNPNCKITVLRLTCAYVDQDALSVLVSAFQENPSHLRELDLNLTMTRPVEFQQLFSLLGNSCFKLETLRIVHISCSFLSGCLETLAAVLGTCSLRCLDFSMCGLKDSSVEILCAGLRNPDCKLEILRMTHCNITEVGAACLATALRSNPSNMREIDLSLNPVKGPGFDQLTSVLEDPEARLEKLIATGLDERRDIEALRQHLCQLTWDPNTASSNVQVTDEDKLVRHRYDKQESIPDHPERFKVLSQVMSREGLQERHFIQVEWYGRFATIGMTYKNICRKVSYTSCEPGKNDKSWAIFVSTPYPICKALHGDVETQLPDCSPWRVGVYLDWAAGILSFYDITDDTAKLLHTLHAEFTQPLFLLVSISAGVKLLSDNPSPVCMHDHDPWDMFRGAKDCKGCNGSKAC